MKDRRCVDDLTIEELERILLIKKRQAREARLRRFAALGRVVSEPPPPDLDLESPAGSSQGLSRPSPFHTTAAVPSGGQAQPVSVRQPGRGARLRDRLLLAVELAALVGLIIVLVSSVLNLRMLNQEVAQARAQPTPTPTPLIRVKVLPGGHEPPRADGTVPEPLRHLVEPMPAVPIPTPGPEAAVRIVIPAIGVDSPVVEGDDWEQLKKGVGHHIGTANPGERGNCFLSGHNDIFGAVFRRLEELELGDEIIVYTQTRSYRYRVKAKRIVDPDDVSVMYPTSTPVLTLMTCYPYLVDTHRLVVVAELEQ